MYSQIKSILVFLVRFRLQTSFPHPFLPPLFFLVVVVTYRLHSGSFLSVDCKSREDGFYLSRICIDHLRFVFPSCPLNAPWVFPARSENSLRTTRISSFFWIFFCLFACVFHLACFLIQRDSNARVWLSVSPGLFLNSVRQTTHMFGCLFHLACFLIQIDNKTRLSAYFIYHFCEVEKAIHLSISLVFLLLYRWRGGWGESRVLPDCFKFCICFGEKKNKPSKR